jgi:hypothetical protein
MTEKAKKFKWNDGLADKVADAYKASNKSQAALDVIAAEIGASRRMVQGKLVSMKLYGPMEKPKKEAKKDEGPSKKDILSAIAKSGVSVDGLEGATKFALTNVADALGVDVANTASAEA